MPYGQKGRGLLRGGVEPPVQTVAGDGVRRRMRPGKIATRLARLRTRVHELEQTNEALGKAIGLLHAMNVEEPDAAQTTSILDDSSPPRTNSSAS